MEPSTRWAGKETKRAYNARLTRESVRAYNLALVILKTSFPARWSGRCNTLDEMRNTFSWVYLRLRYNIQDSRSTVSGRASRRLGTTDRDLRQTNLVYVGDGGVLTPYDPEMVALLRLESYITDSAQASRFESQMEVHHVQYTLLYNASQGSFRLAQESSAPLTTTNTPYSTGISPSIFKANLSGNPFDYGAFVLSSPLQWAHGRKCTFRLIGPGGALLNISEAIFENEGDRYDRRAVSRLPSGYFEVLRSSGMTGVTLEQDLELHDNSVFLFRLVNAVLPTVQPLTSILVTYRFCGSIPSLPSVQENPGYTDDRARGAAIASSSHFPPSPETPSWCPRPFCGFHLSLSSPECLSENSL